LKPIRYQAPFRYGSGGSQRVQPHLQRAFHHRARLARVHRRGGAAQRNHQVVAAHMLTVQGLSHQTRCFLAVSTGLIQLVQPHQARARGAVGPVPQPPHALMQRPRPHHLPFQRAHLHQLAVGGRPGAVAPDVHPRQDAKRAFRVRRAAERAHNPFLHARFALTPGCQSDWSH
jgi:hypothetical protein